MDGSYNPVSLSPANATEQYSSGAQCVPSAVTVIAPAHHPENTTESWSNYYNNHSASNSFGRNAPPKRRCRDYDGKLCFCFPLMLFLSLSYLNILFLNIFLTSFCIARHERLHLNFCGSSLCLGFGCVCCLNIRLAHVTCF